MADDFAVASDNREEEVSEDECPKGGSHSWVDRYSGHKNQLKIGTQCTKCGAWK